MPTAQCPMPPTTPLPNGRRSGRAAGLRPRLRARLARPWGRQCSRRRRRAESSAAPWTRATSTGCAGAASPHLGGRTRPARRGACSSRSAWIWTSGRNRCMKRRRRVRRCAHPEHDAGADPAPRLPLRSATRMYAAPRATSCTASGSTTRTARWARETACACPRAWSNSSATASASRAATVSRGVRCMVSWVGIAGAGTVTKATALHRPPHPSDVLTSKRKRQHRIGAVKPPPLPKGRALGWIDAKEDDSALRAHSSRPTAASAERLSAAARTP